MKNKFCSLFFVFSLVVVPLAHAEYKYAYEFEQYKGYAQSTFESFEDRIRSELERMMRATSAVKYSGPDFIDLEETYDYWRRGGNGSWTEQAELYAQKDEHMRGLLDWYYSGLDSIVSNYQGNFEDISSEYIRVEYARFLEDRKRIFAVFKQADRMSERDGEAERAKYRKEKMLEAVDTAIGNIEFSGGTPPDFLFEVREEVANLQGFGHEYVSPGPAPSY